MAEVVVVSDDDDSAEEIAEVVAEVAETGVEAVAEVATAAVEAAAETPPTAGFVSEEEVARIREYDARLKALEDRPWPPTPEQVAAISETAAAEAVAPVVEAIVAAAEAEPEPVDDEVTIVQPDVEPKKQSWLARHW